MAGTIQDEKTNGPHHDVTESIEDERNVVASQEKDRNGRPSLEDVRGDANSTLTHSSASRHGEVEDAEDHPVALTRTLSNPPAPVPVPRHKRRGLFGRFTVVAEVEIPRHYPRTTKWFITFVIAIAAMAAPMGSAIFLPALGQVAETLHTTPTITNLSVALYMLSMSIFPLWWSSFSERLGRRTIYLTSFALFTLFSILSAIANSIAMLVVMRLLAGGASASVQAVGAGTIADIWEPRERGRAMGTFYLGPLCGPLFAPILGGVLAEAWDWRSTQWFLTAYGGVTIVLLTFGLPETLIIQKAQPIEPASSEPDPAASERTLSRVSSRQVVAHTTKWLKAIKLIFIDPLKIILYLRFPAVLATVTYASITFGCLYVLNISIQDTFSQEPYSLSIRTVGLLYIPPSVGYILSSVIGGRWMDMVMQREAKRSNRVDERGRLIYRPEDRMQENAWFGAVIYPAALLCYGWTAEKGVHLAVPMVSGFFFGVGSMIIFSMSTTMLTEFLPKQASTGVAVNNFLRNIFSCVGGVIAAPVIDAIGNGWLFTILGIVGMLSSSVIWAMKHFGPRWRQSMDEKMG